MTKFFEKMPWKQWNGLQNGVKNVQAADYNGAHKVYLLLLVVS